MVIVPSALNVLIIGLSALVFFFFLRMIAAKNADNSFGKGLGAIVN